MRNPAKHHPAQYSREIIAAIGAALAVYDLPVHDPYAGTGIRLGQLCDQLGLEFTGTEIEPEFIVDPRVHQGDSTQIDSYPRRPFTICTSPSYANGMNDHFRAHDSSRRHTYRQAIANIRGEDRPLHDNNSGRYSIRAGQRSFARYTEISAATVACWWPAPVILNVSDFITGGKVFPLVAYWQRLLTSNNYHLVDPVHVPTRRQRHGANSSLRVDHETIIVAYPDQLA